MRVYGNSQEVVRLLVDNPMMSLVELDMLRVRNRVVRNLIVKETIKIAHVALRARSMRS